MHFSWNHSCSSQGYPLFFQTGLQRLHFCINKQHHVFSCFQMRSSLSSVIFRQQYQPTELLRQVNVFTAIISVILLSSSSFSKYLRFLASNTIPETPYPLLHDLLSFSATSAHVQHSRRCVGIHGLRIGDTEIITCLKLAWMEKNVRLRAIFRFQHLSPNALSGTTSSWQAIHPSFPSWRKNNRVSLFAIRDAVQTWICRYTP